MSTDAYFLSLVRQLEDWHADSVKASDIRPVGSGTHKPGHAILLRNRYPGPNWRALWRSACDPESRRQLLDAVQEEIYGITHGPSRAGPASGLHRGTREWRLAIATSDGSLRAVARRFGISHSEVRRIRLREGVENGLAK